MTIIFNYDDLTFIERRKAFLDWLLRSGDFDVFWTPNTCKYVQDKKNVTYVSRVKFLGLHEIAGEFTRTEPETFDGYNFNKNWNTRFINEVELCIEFDGLSFKKSLDAIYRTCQNLIKLKVHFVLFGCLIETCPHIRIYDFLPEGLDTKEQYMTRLLFCEKVVPDKYFKNLDKHLLVTGKTICLEFAKHWRHSVMFRLLFEHIPPEVGR